MKNLYTYIKQFGTSLKESLLDDLDDLMDISDKNVQHTMADSPEFTSIYGLGWSVVGDTAVRDSKQSPFNYRKAIQAPIYLNGQKSIDDFLATKEVKINDNSLRITSQRTLILSKDTFSKKIITGEQSLLHISGNYVTIKDIDLEIGGKLQISSTFGTPLFSNMNIDLKNKIKQISISSESIPVFMNVKSNARILHIHDTFMFDDEKTLKDIDKLFDFPYTCKVYDHNKKNEVDIVIKSFKKIHAIINNKKRYMITEPILRFKKGITVNDLIDLSGFKDLQDVIINNNLVSLSFHKTGPSYRDHSYAELPGGWVAHVSKK